MNNKLVLQSSKDIRHYGFYILEQPDKVEYECSDGWRIDSVLIPEYDNDYNIIYLLGHNRTDYDADFLRVYTEGIAESVVKRLLEMCKHYCYSFIIDGEEVYSPVEYIIGEI